MKPVFFVESGNMIIKGVFGSITFGTVWIIADELAFFVDLTNVKSKAVFGSITFETVRIFAVESIV